MFFMVNKIVYWRDIEKNKGIFMVYQMIHSRYIQWSINSISIGTSKDLKYVYQRYVKGILKLYSRYSHVLLNGTVKVH